MQILDTISKALTLITAWAMFSIGLMLGYEVFARYFFNAPTIWAEELSRLVLIWVVFVGASTMIRYDEHIRVTIVVDMFGLRAKKLAGIMARIFVVIFAAAICWNGLPAMLDSLERGRTTGSMMDIPSWWLQASIVVGFGLIALQASVQLICDCRSFWDDSDPDVEENKGIL